MEIMKISYLSFFKKSLHLYLFPRLLVHGFILYTIEIRGRKFSSQIYDANVFSRVLMKLFKTSINRSFSLFETKRKRQNDFGQNADDFASLPIQASLANFNLVSSNHFRVCEMSTENFVERYGNLIIFISSIYVSLYLSFHLTLQNVTAYSQKLWN